MVEDMLDEDKPQSLDEIKRRMKDLFAFGRIAMELYLDDSGINYTV